VRGSAGNGAGVYGGLQEVRLYYEGSARIGTVL